MAGTPSLFAGIGAQFFDNTGIVLAGGKIYTYVAGTTTPIATYTTQTANVAHSNPINLDAAGRVPAGGEIWLIEGVGSNYKFVIKDVNDVLIATYDNVPGSYSSTDLANTSDVTKGDALVGFRQSNAAGNLTNAVGRTVHQKLQEYVSVKDFGAVGDGATNDTAAFQNAYDASPENSTIVIPPGNYSISALTGTKSMLWASQGALNGAGTDLLTLPGVLNTMFAKRQILQQTTTSGTDYATINVVRTTSHTGGAAGSVNSGLRVNTTVGSGVTNFEWSFLSVLENNATAGENVAVYGQANKRSTGPTWAGVFEAKDWRPSSGVVTEGLVGLEIDVFANGTDVSNNRIGIDIVAGRTNPADTTCRITWGIRLLAQANNPNNATYQGGILLDATMQTGIQIAGDMDRGIYFTGTKDVGIDFVDATYSVAAMRFGVSQTIWLEPTNVVGLETPTASDTIVKFKNTGVERVGFKVNVIDPGLRVNGIKVVGAQQTAIPNSGDATVNAILAALRNHGLIAT